MVANIRPENLAQLTPIVEELEQRKTDEEQEEILRIIGDVLGRQEVWDEELEEGEEWGGRAERVDGSANGTRAVNGHASVTNGYQESPEPVEAGRGEDDEMEERQGQ